MRQRTQWLELALLVALVLPAGAGAQASGPPGDLVDVLVADGEHATLIAAVRAAGLEETLRGDGPFTLLAPTDDAFSKLPADAVQSLLRPENREQLVGVLTLHVIQGRISASRALQSGVAKSLQGSPLEFSLTDGLLRVKETRVLKNDINASNGVIHVIEAVLLPAQEVAARTRPVEIIELAIARGAPLFNTGQTAACAAIYEVAARSLLMLDDTRLDPVSLRELSDAVRRSSSMRDASARAWALRGALDSVWQRLLDQAASRTDAAGSTATRRSVFEFATNESSPDWLIVNDSVMGGVSQSSMKPTGQGTALFRGSLSLENNGGFATTRSPQADLGLAGYDGLVIRLRGDGRTYGISGLRSDRIGTVNNWRTSFSTQAGEWQEVRVPFADLELTIMGRKVPLAPRLTGEQIRSIAFSISDKDETPFALEIDWIRAYRGGDLES